jgi:hypothetical protein
MLVAEEDLYVVQQEDQVVLVVEALGVKLVQQELMQLVEVAELVLNLLLEEEVLLVVLEL